MGAAAGADVVFLGVGGLADLGFERAAAGAGDVAGEF